MYTGCFFVVFCFHFCCWFSDCVLLLLLVSWDCLCSSIVHLCLFCVLVRVLHWFVLFVFVYWLLMFCVLASFAFSWHVTCVCWCFFSLWILKRLSFTYVVLPRVYIYCLLYLLYVFKAVFFFTICRKTC